MHEQDPSRYDPEVSPFESRKTPSHGESP